MRSSVARHPRRIVGVIGQVSALILAGMTTAQAQAVPRQPPPPSAPGPTTVGTLRFGSKHFSWQDVPLLSAN